eukprot:scaffold37600_cov176-Amphora_coffeaeformis.AAC.2
MMNSKGIFRRGGSWLILFFLGVAVWTAEATGEPSTCTETNNPPRDEQEMKVALHRLVQGYVRAEKASYASVLRDINLIVKDAFPSALVEEVVKEAFDNTFVYADRLIHDMLRTVSDPDCMSGEFDTSREDFDATKAALVLHKCKLLVLRNVFRESFLEEYKTNVTGFIQGLNNEQITQEGTTTNNENYFMQNIDDGRWEIVLPENLAHPYIISNRKIIEIIMHDPILGPDLALHSLGVALGDSGANPQDFHADSDSLFGDQLYQTAGVSQHELPSYAIAVLAPLLHMTPDHGPTQFFMGSSNLAGINEDRDSVKLRDESLRSHLHDQPDLNSDKDNDDNKDYKYTRTPSLTFGDVVLFDYKLIHREGKNISPDLRTMLYMTYSRFWFKDNNFRDNDDDEEEDEDEGTISAQALYKQLTRKTRFAIPGNFEHDDEYEDVTSADWREYGDEEGTLEELVQFHEATN